MLGFCEWMRRMDEMMGSVGSIVSCGDLKNPNFQIQGSLSNLSCGQKSKKKSGGKKDGGK